MLLTRIQERMADEDVSAESDPESDVLVDPEVIDDLVHLFQKV
jgi:hypothetical protein